MYVREISTCVIVLVKRSSVTDTSICIYPGPVVLQTFPVRSYIALVVILANATRSIKITVINGPTHQRRPFKARSTQRTNKSLPRIQSIHRILPRRLLGRRRLNLTLRLTLLLLLLLVGKLRHRHPLSLCWRGGAIHNRCRRRCRSR